jgi:hypothetical protein
LVDGTAQQATPLGGVVPFRRARPRLVPPKDALGTDQELALVVACGLVLDQIAQECDRSLESVYEALVRFRSDLALGNADV